MLCKSTLIARSALICRVTQVQERWRGVNKAAVCCCNVAWPRVYRGCGHWIIPNEWMRRRSRWIRGVMGTPLRSDRARRLAQDFVVEIVQPSSSGAKQSPHPDPARSGARLAQCRGGV